MPSTIAEVDNLFAAGAESITLTRGEWDAIQEAPRRYTGSGLAVWRAQRETERVKRISRPVWRVCKVVSAQMRRALSYASSTKGHIALSKVQDWEMRLPHSMDVNWQDLPADHPKRTVDWRR